MRSYWGIQGGESVEIYNGADVKDRHIIYRIGVERVVKGEVKIVRGSGPAKIINNDSRLKAVDVTVKDSLFIEFVGPNGFAFGWWECVGTF
jgi:hypothetical protein